MYLPSAFAESDVARLLDFVDSHSFATLVTLIDDVPFASQLPLLLDRSRHVLLGHLARANPHWRSFDHQHSLAIFTGPHGYISPTWYTVAPAVPTWNFSAVHVVGPARAILDEPTISDIVDRLSRKYESAPRWLDAMPADYRQRMLQGIVGVELPIARIEGKFKLSQNRSREDRASVIAQLERGDEASRELAALMRQHLPGE